MTSPIRSTTSLEFFGVKANPYPLRRLLASWVRASRECLGFWDDWKSKDSFTRQRGTSDQRIIYVEPTKSAGEVLKRLDVPVSELHQRLIGHLTREELKELVRLLEKARVVTAQH